MKVKYRNGQVWPVEDRESEISEIEDENNDERLRRDPLILIYEHMKKHPKAAACEVLITAVMAGITWICIIAVVGLAPVAGGPR